MIEQVTKWKTSDPYKPLRRVMRRDVHEYGTDIPWRELYESVRLEHLAAFLRCVPEGADAVIADAITDMVRGHLHPMGRHGWTLYPPCWENHIR